MYENGDLLNGRQIVLWLHFAESTGGMNMKTDVCLASLLHGSILILIY